MDSRVLTAVSCIAVLGAGHSAASEKRFSAWSAPVNIGVPVNSSAGEFTPEISRDGSTLYFSRQMADGNVELMVSKWDRAEKAWGDPEPLVTLNTPSNELGPTLSPDGRSMYFSSNRPGGCGGFDVWVSHRRNKREDFGGGGWRTPYHLGCVLNTPSLDSPNAYVENRHAGTATLNVTHAPDLLAPTESDICESERTGDDGEFGPCVPLPDLSTEHRDARVTFRRDGLEAFLESRRPESANDLWVATRDSTFDPWSPMVNLGSAINTVCPQLATCNDQSPRLSFDGKLLYFTSNRPGGGGSDIYVITRHRIHDDEE